MKTIKEKELYRCIYCHENASQKKDACCSVECSSKYKKQLKFIEIEINDGNGCDIRRIKEYLINKRGHKCEICENTAQLNNPIPLIIDHINGRSSDNRLVNLRLVCGNCDMQLPTYKSKNKKSDRQRIGKQ